MTQQQLFEIEREAINFDTTAIEARVDKAIMTIAATENTVELKTEVCSIWKQIRRFVKLGEMVPVIGKYISILVKLLDSFCNTGN